MASALVPRIPPRIIVASARQRVRAGNPIYGDGQWYQMALIANWLCGKGSTIACSGPMVDTFAGYVIAPGETWSLTHRIDRNQDFGTYLWLISLTFSQEDLYTTFTSQQGAFGEFADGDTSTKIGTWSLGAADMCKSRPFRAVQQIGFASTANSVTLEISNDAASISGICFAGCTVIEMPRSNLGVQHRTLKTAEPIYDTEGEDADSVSLRGVANQLVNRGLPNSRRACLFSAVFPDVQRYTTTQATFTEPAFYGYCKQTRTHYGNSQWPATYVILYSTGPSAGLEIKITTGQTGLDTDSKTILIGTQTTPTYATGTISVRADNLGNDGALRDNEYEYVDVRARLESGTGEVYIYGFWLFG